MWVLNVYVITTVNLARKRANVEGVRKNTLLPGLVIPNCNSSYQSGRTPLTRCSTSVFGQ
jgi:hypothetical protein